MIGLIVPANTKISPYIQYYISFFHDNHLEYKIISWDKKGEEKTSDYVLRFLTKDKQRLRVLFGHALFAAKCRHIIRKEKFDYLVIFTIAPLYFLGKHFLLKYKGRFISDIRDDSPFRRKFPLTLKKYSSLAYETVVSSDHYSPWVNHSIMCHNADINMVKKSLNYKPDEENVTTIRIVYAGLMIEERKNINILQELKNDNRFIFVFVGRENEGKKRIEEYVKENDVKNVVLEGEYKKEDITNIYRKEADLVNIFRAHSRINSDALPNKLYDAAIAGKPIVVFSHNTAIVEYAEKYKLGIIIDDNEKIGEKIFSQYRSFNFQDYKKGRIHFLEKIISDEEQFEKMLTGFICKKEITD